MLHSPFSVHLCLPLGTVKPCFVSEKVTRADPRTVRFDKILNFRATIVIQIFVREVWSTVHPFRVLQQTLMHSLLFCRERQQNVSHNPAFHYSTEFHVGDLCSMSSVY